jgi:D-glycero-alpha-D-manno-heptose-7-phosphate kinase
VLLTKTPLRISFFGGGSDLSYYYEYTDGLCVSTTINSFIYLACNKCVANHLKVIYSKLELATHIEDIKHSRVREALKFFGLTSNLEIASFSDVPTLGTGLGSSSTFTVGLVKALYYIKYGHEIESTELAEIACYIEIDRCKEPIGLQDQYAAAIGGFNQYRFTKAGVQVEPVPINPSVRINLESRLLFFNTGISRSASEILAKQVEKNKSGANTATIGALVDMAEVSLKYLQNNKLHDFGQLLHESWLHKKKVSDNISNDIIDEMYDLAMKNGALGGKILGAGGGGYLMIYVPLSKKTKVIEALSNYEKREFSFYNKGCTLEYSS